MLAAYARAADVTEVSALHAGDSAQALAEVLDQAADADLVVLAGGVSMGRYDLVPQALCDHGASVVFHKVRQKPGKPLLFAKGAGQLVFGLPGTPLGCHMCFHRYVVQAIRRFMGRAPAFASGTGHLTETATVRSGRTLFLLARVAPGPEGWEVTAVSGKGSSDLFRPAAANAFLRLPPGEHAWEAGTEVAFEWIGAWR